MQLFGHPASVRPYFGYRSAERLVLIARALRRREPKWDRNRTIDKLAAMLADYTPAAVAAITGPSWR